MIAAWMAATVLAASSAPRVDVGTMYVPEPSRSHMVQMLDAILRCEAVELGGTRSTCERLPDGKLRYTDRNLKSGQVEGELEFGPDFDGVQRMAPLPGGHWAREEHFAWRQAPELVVDEDTDRDGRVDARTEGTLDATRAVFHLVKRVLAPDGSWKLASERDAKVREASTSALPFLAAGDWEHRLLANKPAPAPKALEVGFRKLLAGEGLDLDNDGAPDVQPIAGVTPTTATFANDRVVRVRGEADGELFVEKAVPYTYEERRTGFLRIERVIYTDTDFDGRFDTRRTERTWRWQSMPEVTEERDLHQDGHWTVQRTWQAEPCHLQVRQ